MHPADHIRGQKDDVLEGKTIVLGVTGSIAAVETVKLARELTRLGARVIPVMTHAAARIIHPDALWFACGTPAITELTGAVEHVALCGDVPDHADLLLIAPCTANTIGKIAYGVDDTPVTTMATTALGTGIPVVLVPAMHGSMYENPMVAENLDKLSAAGIIFTGPKIEEGKAKMASQDDIVLESLRALGPRKLEYTRVLVIAGPTREPVDSMRTLTN
ncbi:MAG: DNA/pantothenate metabolism flavoprotein, partial [Thermoplasmata archaeon]|nr:DNA/pantothenate metabolism flavoprotein [Thermoplasmata archaeon]